METTPTTDYFVISIQGRSQGGGTPDTTANKILKNWYLKPGTPGKELHEYAIPMETHVGKIKLKVWVEGSGKRGKLIFDDGAEGLKLDHGVIIEDKSVGEDQTHRIITINCNWLLQATIECMTDMLTVATVTQEPSCSPESIITIQESGAPILTAPAGLSAPDSTESQKQTTPSARRNTATMKNTENQKSLIDWTIKEVATRSGTTVKEMLGTSERKGPLADGKKFSVHLLKDIIGIRPVTQLLPIFTPGSANTGYLYGIAKRGMAIAKKAPYKKLAEDISEGAAQFSSNSSASTAPKKALVTVHRNTKQAAVSGSNELIQEACICTLIEAGIPAEQVANGFDVSLESVYTAVGRLTITDIRLVQKIRMAVKPIN